MSIHSSLRGVDTLVGQRSVLSRVERLQQLSKKGKHDLKSQSVFNLPKVRTKFKAIVIKKVEVETPVVVAPVEVVPEEPVKGGGKGGKGGSKSTGKGSGGSSGRGSGRG